MRSLGTLEGGNESYATAINNLGEVVGVSLTASTTPHAFIYRNGTMTPLGASLGGTQSVANDLNEAGQVVGRASRAGDTSFRAFLFAGGGVRPRLKTPKCKMH